MASKESGRAVVAEGYRADGRKSLEALFFCYSELTKAGWQREEIAGTGVVAYLSAQPRGKPVDALWIIGGIHGEEPAGPNAFAEKIETIKDLPSKHNIPVVFLPLANPIGYFYNWRYLNSHERNPRRVLSVGDSDHLLAKIKNPNKPRAKRPSNPIAASLTEWVVRTSFHHRPLLVIDHHEDELEEKSKHPDAEMSYGYAHGNIGIVKPLTLAVAAILKKNGFPLTESGTTRFKEKIQHGFIFNSHDGSIDELLASDHYFLDKARVGKTAAKAVIVIETTFNPGKTPLRPRVETHAKIIEAYTHFWSLLQRQQS